MDIPKNIALWAMHRSGSTHFAVRLRDSLQAAGANAGYIGECSGWGGVVPYQTGQTTLLEEIMEQINQGGDYLCEHIAWQIDPHGVVTNKRTTGSVAEEIKNRLAILKAKAWKNNLIFKMHPWPHLENVFDEYADAVLFNNDFQHVLLWRKSLYDYVCSRFVLRQKKTPHGFIEWDGVPLEFRSSWAQQHFLDRVSLNLEEFVKMANTLVKCKNKVTMLETTSLNSINRLEFDQCALTLSPPEGVARGRTVYFDSSKQRHLPKDMITIETQLILQKWADVHIEKYDWNNLDKNLGFKTI